MVGESSTGDETPRERLQKTLRKNHGALVQLPEWAREAIRTDGIFGAVRKNQERVRAWPPEVQEEAERWVKRIQTMTGTFHRRSS